jgi:hypothetical protein
MMNFVIFTVLHVSLLLHPMPKQMQNAVHKITNVQQLYRTLTTI